MFSLQIAYIRKKLHDFIQLYSHLHKLRKFASGTPAGHFRCEPAGICFFCQHSGFRHILFVCAVLIVMTLQLQKNLPNLPLFIGESGGIVVRQIDLAGTSGGFEDLEKSTAALQLHCGLDNTCEDLLLPMIVV